MTPGLFIFWALAVCLLIAGALMAFINIEQRRNKARGNIPRAIDIVQDDNKSIASNSNAVATPLVMSNKPIAPVYVDTIDVATLEPNKRQHTIVAAKPGDGKTTTGNTMIVADLLRGAEVIVLNPHFTYYHFEDQRIDLRPLRHLLTVVYDYDEIEIALRNILHTVNERLVLYREGQDVGSTVCVYLDEWPAISGDDDHGKNCARLLSQIIRQARKCNIWIILLTQDALVETLQLSGGIRANFATRLVGNVDNTTWRQLLGRDVQQQAVRQGTWFAASGSWQGIVTTTPPHKHTIALAASQQARSASNVPSLTSNTPVAQKDDSELLEVWDWIQEQPKPSQRELARRLYRLRGGTNVAYDGSGDLYYEVVTLADEARKRYGVMALSGL